MPKSTRRVRRQKDSPAQQPARDQRTLLARILDAPHLAHVVPRLPPEVLHRLIQTCGLEDCGELVALATPDQLARVFDLDLWRSDQPGLDEQFDADRFGVWLEVLMESGAKVAAQALSNMDVDLVIAGTAQYVAVFDSAAVSPSPSMDGDEEPAVRTMGDGPSCEIGGYLVVARRNDSWDAILSTLATLNAEHPDAFHRVMGGCRSLSNSAPELDGLDDLLGDAEQVMFDLALARERRRERQGYVDPAHARAFLKMARQLRLGDDTTPPANPVARAYFRAIEWTTTEDTSSGVGRLPAASDTPPIPNDSADAFASVADALLEAGVITQQPRALLDGPQGPAPRLARIQAELQAVHDCNHDAYSVRTQDLAYLANTIVAGCSIQARPFSAQEGSDAAVAICNLGLENWPPHWLPAKEQGEAFLVGHDLVTVFQVGWTVLHHDVCMDAAERLIKVLTQLRCEDREIQTGLNALRIEMTKHWQAGAPWRAQSALEVMTILDMPAWASLLGLIAECPVMHAGIGASRVSGIRAVSASAFEFISENSQIAIVREFMQSLPDILRS